MEKESYKEKLKNITTFIFDVDGVMTDGTVQIFPSNDMIRTMHTRDGLAIGKAIKEGYNVCIITGGNAESVEYRMNYLGVTDVFLMVKDKVAIYNSYKEKKGFSNDQVLYMGDDVPDYPVVKIAGIGACPNDAIEEVKAIADYISPIEGGKGCVRDVIQQVLRVQNKWFEFE